MVHHKNRRHRATGQVVKITAPLTQDEKADRPIPVKTKDNHALGKWYEIEDLIAGLDAPIPLKYMLERIRRRTNSRKRFAWASQKSLAWDMGVSLPTVERAFAQAKAMGLVGVRRVRTGKNPSDQHNEYWLIPERMKQLQRPPQPRENEIETDTEHPSPVMGDTTVSKLEHASNGARTPITSDGGSTKYFKTADASALTPVAGGSEFVAVSELDGIEPKPNHPPSRKPSPDDSATPVSNSQTSPSEQPQTKPSLREGRIKNKAQAILEKRGLDPDFVTKVLNLIRKLARTAPATSNYYITAFESDSIDGWEARVKANFVQEVVEAATREGRPASEVLRERLQQDLP